MIYQKTVPEPIFNILMKLTTFEVGPGGVPGGLSDDIDDDLPRAPSSGRATGPPSESGFSESYDKLETGTNSPTASVPSSSA